MIDNHNKDENGTYTFKNGDYTLTMDAKKDTISCNSIERFVLVNHKIYYKDEEAEYIKTIGSSTEDEVKPFSVDLGKYDIDIASANTISTSRNTTAGYIFLTARSAIYLPTWAVPCFIKTASCFSEAALIFFPQAAERASSEKQEVRRWRTFPTASCV